MQALAVVLGVVQLSEAAVAEEGHVPYICTGEDEPTTCEPAFGDGGT